MYRLKIGDRYLSSYNVTNHKVEYTYSYRKEKATLFETSDQVRQIGAMLFPFYSAEKVEG